MAHSYVNALFHCIFSTKHRRPLIHQELQDRLWPYLGGIARDNGMVALEVGGVADHAHLLLSLPSTLSVAKALQLLKGGSSKWIHDTFPRDRNFAWQKGYGAFSIGTAQIGVTRRYIANQRAHHRNVSFQDEFIAILERHEITYDPRFIWT